MGIRFPRFNQTRTHKKIKMPKGGGLTKPMKLSEDLAAIVGKKEASRAECIKELWAYLKKNNLQDPDNKQYFTPDKKMAKVFGTDRIRAFGMAKFLSEHLSLFLVPISIIHIVIMRTTTRHARLKEKIGQKSSLVSKLSMTLILLVLKFHLLLM